MVYFSEICAFPKRQVFHAQNKYRNQQHLLDLNYRSYRGSCSCIFIAVRPWKEMKLCQEILRDVVGVWGWGVMLWYCQEWINCLELKKCWKNKEWLLIWQLWIILYSIKIATNKVNYRIIQKFSSMLKFV